MRFGVKRTGRTIRSGGLLCLVACVAPLACTQKDATPSTAPTTPPANPDPRPSTRIPPTYVIHYVNDSTLAVEYTFVDTIPFSTVYLGLETTVRPAADFPAIYGLGTRFEVISRTLSPARYTVHRTDTLPSRPPGRNWTWAVTAQNTNGKFPDSGYGDTYIGPREFSLILSGVPKQPMQQPGIELMVTPRGPATVRKLAVYLDSGTAQQQTYGVVPVEAPELGSPPGKSWHVWVTGPIHNGPHTLTISGTDSLARTYSSSIPLDVQMPTPAYRVRVIDLPGTIDVRAAGLNSAGVVVGTYRRPDSTQHAFRWADGTLDSLPSTGVSRAEAISDAGLIAGFNRNGSSDSLVSWSGSTRHALASIYWYYAVQGTNDRGDILLSNGLYSDGAILSAHMFYPLGMNNLGTIVGAESVSLNPNAPAIFDGVAYTPSPPYSPTYTGWDVVPHCCGGAAQYVNDRKQIIGNQQNSPVQYLFEKGKPSYWLVNPLGLGWAYAMSRWTLVLGRLTDGTIAVWHIGAETALPAVDLSDWTIDELRGINENGQVIAHGVNRISGRKAALLLDPL